MRQSCLRSSIAAATLLLFAGAAQAEEAAPDPCAHSSSQLRIAGIDLTQLRCHLLVDERMSAGMYSELRSAVTNHAVAAADLLAEKAAMQKREADLAAWFKAYFDAIQTRDDDLAAWFKAYFAEPAAEPAVKE